MKNAILKVKDIKLNKEFYIRNNVDWQTALQYQNSMLIGDKFPPIVVTKRKDGYYLVDGAHRLDAHKRLQRKQKKFQYINAIITKPLNDAELYAESVRLNTLHGIRLSSYERANVALRLRDMGYPDVKIANLIRTPVSDLRKFIVSKTAIDSEGKMFVLKGAVHHLAGQTLTKQQSKAYYSEEGTHQLTMFREINKLFANNLIDRKNKSVMKELAILKILIRKLKL